MNSRRSWTIPKITELKATAEQASAKQINFLMARIERPAWCAREAAHSSAPAIGPSPEEVDELGRKKRAHEMETARNNEQSRQQKEAFKHSDARKASTYIRGMLKGLCQLGMALAQRESPDTKVPEGIKAEYKCRFQANINNMEKEKECE